MVFNQTLKLKIELGSYSVGKIRFFGVALDFAIEPVLFSPSPANLFESMIGHPPVPGYQGEYPLTTFDWRPAEDSKVHLYLLKKIIKTMFILGSFNRNISFELF